VKKAILWLTAGILLVLITGFLIPGSVEKFSLNKEKFFGGEYWRLGTYPFVHLNVQHLIENAVGLVLVGFIAFELKTNFRDYTLTYFSSAFLAVLPLWLIITFIALGSSAAVYALFGFVSFGMKEFGIKSWYTLVLLVLIIFSSTIVAAFTGAAVGAKFIQSLAHFSGLVSGIALYLGLLLLKRHTHKRKSRLLRGM